MLEDSFLTLAAFLTAVLSGMIGMAGGMTLLAVMANFFPPVALIPLHGVVQLASNSSRVLLHLKNVKVQIVLAFAVGGILGSIAGTQIVLKIPEDYYKLFLGCFILFFTWAPKFKSKFKVPGQFFFLGSIVTFLSLIVGATGPIIAPFFLRANLKKEQLIATKAACQMVTHFGKIGVFAAVGFSFGPYFWLLVAMVAAVVIGNYVGKLLLGKISEKIFVWLYKGVLSVLSVRMLYLGFMEIMI